MTEQYILVCNDFLKALSDISEDHKESIDYGAILNILDCIHLEKGFHLKVRFPHFKSYGDKSWFYCYEGEHDIYEEEYNKSVKDVDEFFINYMYDETYNLFNHLIIDSTEMGAWQAYLMSIATHFLPTYWHGGYSRREMVFSDKDVEQKKFLFFLCRNKIKEIPVFGDLPPFVALDGNKAIIKSCYWNMWSGLVRETAEIRFLDKKAYFLEPARHEILFKYNCGIKF